MWAVCIMYIAYRTCVMCVLELDVYHWKHFKTELNSLSRRNIRVAISCPFLGQAGMTKAIPSLSCLQDVWKSEMSGQVYSIKSHIWVIYADLTCWLVKYLPILPFFLGKTPETSTAQLPSVHNIL